MSSLEQNFFLFFFLLFISNSFGQTNLLEGKITDIKSGKPIQGAMISINYRLLSYSDNDGIYRINNIPDGTYNIRISRIGYTAISEILRIDHSINDKNFQLQQSPIELDEVIVITDRTENYLRNSAYSEALVGSDDIEMRPFQSIPDVLKYEPGITLLRDGIWGTEVNIRGLTRENVVTLIDGNRIVTSTDVAARLSMVDMNDVERVEIIKGASSTVYGSGATGGIVNIISKTPEFRSRYFLNGSISGGFNSVNNSGITSGTLLMGETFWSSKITGSYRKAGNTETPAGELINSQYEDYSLSACLNLKPLDNHLLKINYQMFKAENVGIPGASVFPGNAVVRYPDEKREMISAQYDIQNISKLLYKLSAKYSYQFIDRNVENMPNTVQISQNKRVSVLKITPRAEHRNNNVEVLGHFLLNEDNNLIFGADYWDRSYLGNREKYQLIEALNSAGDVVSTTNKIIGEKPLPDSKSKNLGIFLQDEASLSQNLSFSLGIRGDKIFISGEETRNPIYEVVNGVLNPALKDSVIWEKTEINTESYSSNLGLKYSINKNTDLTLSLGLSFRSPSLEERFQFIDQGNYIRLGNPALKSEIGRAADLGIRFYFSDLKIVSSIFYNYFTDLVVEEPGTFDGRPAYIKTNVGKAGLYGFEISADYNFYKESILYATSSYVKGDDITYSRPLPGIPPLNSIIGLKTVLFNELEADLSSRIFFEQIHPAPGEMSTPGYAVFDLTINTRPIDLSSFSIQFYSGVENILDKSYRDHLATTRGTVKLEPGRNIYLKLVTRW